MLTMYKFSLEAALKSEDGLITLNERFSSQVSATHVAIQDGELFLWTVCTDRGDKEKREFVVRGTGHEITHKHKVTYLVDYKHIGTVHNGPFVWHVFEIVSRL